MRLEGVEPPRPCGHGDLNAARLPVPPQPRGCRKSSGGRVEGVPESYEQACAEHEWNVPERYNIAADVCDKHPRDEAGDGLGALRRRDAASSTGASSRTSPTRPPTAARPRGRARATGSRSSSRPPPRRRRSSSAPGSWARSCSRCRSSTATTASATGSRTRPRRCWSPTPRTRRASTPRWSTSCWCSTTATGCSPATRPTTICEDTSADDPAQLYYTSGTTGKAKGIVHAHRYILAHEEFVYCHDIRDGEALPRDGRVGLGGGHLPPARPLAPGRGPVRAPARGRLRPRRPARLPLPPPGHERVHDPDRDAGDDGDRRRRRALPAGVPDRLLRRRAAEPGGDPLVSRPVRGHGARLLRAHRVLPAVRELPLHGGARGLDGPADAGLGRPDPRRGRAPGRAGRARRDLPARPLQPPLPARLLEPPRGVRGDVRRRVVPHQGRGDAWTPTATSGTRAAPTT